MKSTTVEVQNILQNELKTDIEIYFDLQRFYEQKYGENTVVFFEKNKAETLKLSQNNLDSALNRDFTNSSTQIQIEITL